MRPQKASEGRTGTDSPRIVVETAVPYSLNSILTVRGAVLRTGGCEVNPTVDVRCHVGVLETHELPK